MDIESWLMKECNLKKRERDRDREREKKEEEMKLKDARFVLLFEKRKSKEEKKRRYPKREREKYFVSQKRLTEVELPFVILSLFPCAPPKLHVCPSRPSPLHVFAACSLLFYSRFLSAPLPSLSS